MKPSELYKQEPKETTKCIGHLKGFHYDHVKEISDVMYVNSYYELKNEKIETKFYVNHSFDGRRLWQLASVWYEDKPVMIIQNAGREGDDHSKRFITDVDTYQQMIQYIITLVKTDKEVTEDIYSPEDEIDNLDTFYGYHMATVEREYY